MACIPESNAARNKPFRDELLGPRNPAASRCLGPLLPSGPDGVGGTWTRRAQPSTQSDTVVLFGHTLNRAFGLA